METPEFPVNLSDIELLEQLCSTSDDKLLYNHFTERFLPDLLKECHIICKTRKLDSHIGTQIAHDTFERVRKYKSFNKDEIKIPNDRRAILVYLKRISTRLFSDHHKKEKTQAINHRTYFDDIFDSVALKSDVKELKLQKELATTIFSKLNKKEQRIVLVDIEHKKHQKYLPDNVPESLAKELGIKPASVRKIRERAIEKIIKAINEINQQ